MKLGKQIHSAKTETTWKNSSHSPHWLPHNAPCIKRQQNDTALSFRQQFPLLRGQRKSDKRLSIKFTGSIHEQNRYRVRWKFSKKNLIRGSSSMLLSKTTFTNQNRSSCTHSFANTVFLSLRYPKMRIKVPPLLLVSESSFSGPRRIIASKLFATASNVKSF